MKYALITVTINLLSVAAWCQQKQHHEVNLISRLKDYFVFDHNIFLLDRKLDPDHYVVATSPCSSNYCKFTPQSVYTFENSSGNENTTTIKSITSKNTLLIIAVEDLNSGNSLKILAEFRRIRDVNVRSHVKIGLFIERNVTSTHTVEQLFRRSWSVRIVNIFCAFYLNGEDDAPSFNVISFDPFGTFNVINVTGTESLQSYFPIKVPNYRGYPLRFLKVKNLIVSYVEYNLWETVVSVFNASKSMTHISYKDYIALKTISADIVPHDSSETHNLQIYPHRITTRMLLVPHARPYSSLMAYLQNTTLTLLIAYAFIAIAMAILLLTVSGYLKTKKILVFQCVADVINLLMNDNGAIRYGQLNRADVCVIVPLTFTGLIVVNGVLSVFQSFFTLPIYERQINTIDDIFESPSIKIFVDEVYWVKQVIEILENVSHHGGWSDKVRPIDIVLLRKELNKFNGAISTILPDSQAQCYLNVQKQLDIKVYHLITEPLMKYIGSFKVNDNFPFTEPVNDIIHRFQSAGLIDKWLKDSYLVGEKYLWKSNFNRHFKTSHEPGSDEFAIPPIVWWGWIASAVAFACEIIWNQVKLKVKHHIEKLKTFFR